MEPQLHAQPQAVAAFNYTEYADSIMVWAKAQKTRFDALVQEGFTADQALELVKENIRKTGGF